MATEPPDTRWISHAQNYIDEARVCLDYARPILSAVHANEGPEFGSAEHNVALWMLGFAVELAYKAVVASEGREPRTSHKLTEVSKRTPRPTRRRIEKVIVRRLELRERGLQASQLWAHIDDKIGYESRRYWNVSREGEFGGTHFGPLVRTPDPSIIVVEDVYLAAEILLEMAAAAVRAAGGPTTRRARLEFRNPAGVPVRPGMELINTGMTILPPEDEVSESS